MPACAELSKDSADGCEVWREVVVIAILWVDVLEGAIDRWNRISLPLQAGEAKRTI